MMIQPSPTLISPTAAKPQLRHFQTTFVATVAAKIEFATASAADRRAGVHNLDVDLRHLVDTQDQVAV